MYFIFVSCVFGIAFATEPCTTPNDDQGTCKSFQECNVLRRMVNKIGRTSVDEQYLRRSKCGYEGQIPLVCCPNTKTLPCTTADDTEGLCVSIQSCPHLLELAKQPNNPIAVQYIRNSICAGPMEFSVCCGDAPDLLEPVFEQCDRTVTALPPDPEGDCCGLDSYVGNKIIGGTATSINQYPWLVVIEYVKLNERRKLLCGGSLISGKYVLTAAHCVTGPVLRRGVPKYVRLGEYNVTNEGPDCMKLDLGEDCTDEMILAPIEELIPHPGYDHRDISRQHDIALIRLKIFAPFTDFIRPICLPNIDYLQSPPLNFSFFIAGWGRALQNATLNKNSDVKMHVQVPYVDRETCQAAVRILPGVEDIKYGEGQICAGGVKGRSSCRGDSGGPLMYENEMRVHEAIGIVSAGPLYCGREGIPTVFAYIYRYLPWINQIIRP